MVSTVYLLLFNKKMNYFLKYCIIWSTKLFLYYMFHSSYYIVVILFSKYCLWHCFWLSLAIETKLYFERSIDLVHLFDLKSKIVCRKLTHFFCLILSPLKYNNIRISTAQHEPNSLTILHRVGGILAFFSCSFSRRPMHNLRSICKIILSQIVWLILIRI